MVRESLRLTQRNTRNACRNRTRNSVFVNIKYLWSKRIWEMSKMPLVIPVGYDKYSNLRKLVIRSILYGSCPVIAFERKDASTRLLNCTIESGIGPVSPFSDSETRTKIRDWLIMDVWGSTKQKRQFSHVIRFVPRFVSCPKVDGIGPVRPDCDTSKCSTDWQYSTTSNRSEATSHESTLYGDIIHAYDMKYPYPYLLKLESSPIALGMKPVNKALSASVKFSARARNRGRGRRWGWDGNSTKKAH